MLPGILIGMTVATAHPDILASQGAFTGFITNFIDLGGEAGLSRGVTR